MNKDYLDLLMAHRQRKSFKFKNRTSNGDEAVNIYIYEAIHSSEYQEAVYGGISAAKLVKEIDTAQGDVVLHINSPGGDVFAGMAIYNALKASKVKTKAVVEGFAASAAAIVMLGASEIEAHEASMIMVHKAWGVTIGNADDHREQVDTLNKIDSLIHSIIKDRSGASEDVVNEWLSKDTFFTAKEALDNGLIDSIISNENRDEDMAKMNSLYQRYRSLCS